MTFARHIAVLIMVVLVLPWGAALRLAEARVAGEPPVAQAVAVSHQQSTVARASAVTHKCRTATLPGAPCFHATLPDETALAAPDHQRGLIRPDTARIAARPTDAPDTGPPRFV
ncbi:MAG: hypothetical protein VX874_18140 [Pseudomonadota bacterium]|nr:hypothetical protein [Pseudomonadota bacterium]